MDLGGGRTRRERYWLHALLLFLTLLTTSAVGSRLSDNFYANRPAILEDDLLGAVQILIHPASLLTGLPFSLTLLTILLAHEMGTISPAFITASMPACPISCRLPPSSARWARSSESARPSIPAASFLTWASAGPLAGFVFIIPALAIGLAYSKILPGIADRGDLTFSTPGLVRLLEWMIFPGVAVSDIYLHPVARAAWVGVLATALNLLPIGQLDGGHILYSFIGDRHKPLTLIFIAALIPMGLLYSKSWLLWAVLLFIFGRKHPRIFDPVPMDAGRTQLALLAAVIFALSFSFSPLQ
jgi:Predicted membrane-associated Zn-dependent proteases 1